MYNIVTFYIADPINIMQYKRKLSEGCGSNLCLGFAIRAYTISDLKRAAQDCLYLFRRCGIIAIQ